MKQVIAWIGSMMLAHTLYGQTQLSVINLPPDKIWNIQTYVAGDNVIVSFVEPDYKLHADVKQFYIIGSDGNSTTFRSDSLAKAISCGASRYGDEYYLYHFNGKRKNLRLGATVFHTVTNKHTISAEEIDINGVVLGIWNDENLCIASFDKHDNRLHVLKVNKLQAIEEKIFDIPFAHMEDYQHSLGAITEGNMTSLEKGAAQLKLYKRDEEIIMTVDQNFFGVSGTPQTIVMKFDLMTGSQTMHEIKVGESRSFTSFVHQNKLYTNSISRKKFELSTFDLKTGSLISRKGIKKDSVDERMNVYIRSGKKGTVYKTESFLKMMSQANATEPSIIVYNGKNASATIVWGTYLKEAPTSAYYAGFAGGLAGSAVYFIVYSAITDLSSTQGTSRYLYLVTPDKQNPEFTTEANNPLRQQIDDYEMRQQEKKVAFVSKGYVDYQNGAIATYLDHKNHQLLLVQFKGE